MAQSKKKQFVARGKNAKKRHPKRGGAKRRKKTKRSKNSRARTSWGGLLTVLRSIWETIINALAGLRDRIWFEDEPEPPPKKRAGKEKRKMAEEAEIQTEPEKTADPAPEASEPSEPSEAPAPPAADSSDDSEDISWNQQVSSIIFGVLALFMFTLIVFKGDNLWTVMHNFIFGLFGNMAILWNALLVYSGYMFAKQKGALRILEITRAAAGIIIFIDVLNYILIQSNGYRNVYNELTYGTFDLLGQIYDDGSRLGGTGLIGGIIGEILLRLLGKMGGAIVCGLALFGLSMLISHTTPVALIEGIRDGVKHGWNVATAMFREEIPQRVKSMISGEEEVHYALDAPDGEEYQEDNAQTENPDIAYTAEANEMFVVTDEPADDITGYFDDPPQEEAAPEINLAEMSVGDLVKKVTSKKKKKKTKAEEIEEQREEFAKQVETANMANTAVSANTAEPGETTEDAGEEEYKYPTVRLLIASKNTNESDSQQELIETADKLINTLAEYGVKASISDVSRGPTVTRYEINPAPGVKINKITNLSNDIALRLAAQSIRIEAPIPGKPAVGIEIPNKNKQMVRIREIIGSREFIEATGALTVALGKDIEGNIVLCDLSKMPHLLIAGSTGSGKSVCVNSMLMSLLYKYSPKEVRMVLIDPKSVEFDMYNGIPHLLVPVVCEPKKAAGALQWAVSEMLKRYGMLKEHGARNIDNYNRLAEETGEFEKLCRIVIVIDEMADLMIASPKEVEDAIARLAAMARAAGMYMVLATQRPSVDVITGTIKNNIPSRIALAVSSQIDSRTILDEGGAENLIGYGDMLYHPMGSSKHTRVQGCFVDDIEVDRVIKFVKQNGSAEYDDSIADEIERNSMDGAGEGSADFADKDEFFEKAVEIVTEAGQASTSMLQRRLGVGYARAGRIIDQLEEQGIIGPYEGSKPRAVLITRAQWLEMTMSKIPSGKNDSLVRSHSQFAAQTLDNGHEEITARQSEFFNADEAEDDYIEYETVESTDEETEDLDENIEVEFTEDSEQEFSDEETELVYDDTEEAVDDSAVEEADETVIVEVPEETAEDSDEMPVIRDFTSFFTDSPLNNTADKAEEAPTVEPVQKTAEDVDETPAVRDFTEFFADSAANEDEAPPLPEEDDEDWQITDFEGIFSDNTEEAAAISEEVPTVRDFTEYFDDSADNVPAEESLQEDKPQGRDFTEFFSNDEELPDDLPPWEDAAELPALTEKESVRQETEKASSRRNLFDDDDDDDDDFDDILSASWVKRL